MLCHADIGKPFTYLFIFYLFLALWVIQLSSKFFLSFFYDCVDKLFACVVPCDNITAVIVLAVSDVLF